MSDYLLQHGTRRTAQGARARTDQVPNSEGGFVWAVDSWTRLRRFLILGSEGGSYYASERELTFDNITAIRECIAEDGPRTVEEIVAVSDAGRAPKNDPALYALAACISYGDFETKLAAGKALPTVARIATHLYHFVAYAETMRGWGRMLRKAVSEWYAAKGERSLAYDAVKYRQRDGWSHRDLLRLAHPRPGDEDLAVVFDWITHGTAIPDGIDAVEMIGAYELAQKSASAKETATLIRTYRLPREAVLTDHLADPEVWQALLDVGMPLGAMIRNLANMTRLGLLTPTAEATKTVLAALSDRQALRKARIHPLAVLFGMATYAGGQGFRGTNVWSPVPQVVDALDGAFYLSFENVEPTGKRTLIALDVSGSMVGGSVAGTALDPRTCAAALALVTAKTEAYYECVGFYAATDGYVSPSRSRFSGRTDGLTPIPLSARQRLDDVVRMTSGLPFGGTDCALPMLYAAEEGKEFDAFLVYTDSETWAGGIHPFEALRQYRERFVADAKLVVVGMVSNGFTIADPNDAGMMDVVGMDTATPGLISEFVAGRI